MDIASTAASLPHTYHTPTTAASPYPALLCPSRALPCPALPCPALPCPALPCPALPCPAPPCPAPRLAHYLQLLDVCRWLRNALAGLPQPPLLCEEGPAGNAREEGESKQVGRSERGRGGARGRGRLARGRGSCASPFLMRACEADSPPGTVGCHQRPDTL